MHTKRLLQKPANRRLTNPLARIVLRVLTLAVVSSTLTATGCQSCSNTMQYNGMCDRFIAKRIAGYEARTAWWSYKSRCGSNGCLSDSKRGFINGYKNCALGGDCRPPIVPERRYWSTWYQSSYGQQRINGWYEGYPMGVAAARSKGHGYQLRTPVTEEVSAYLSATSPMAMQENRRNSARQTEPAQQPALAPANSSATLIGRPMTRSDDAERRPVLRKYLDLPSDASVVAGRQDTDPFLDAEASEVVKPFDSNVDIVPSTRRTNDFAGDFPAELLPRHN